MSAKRKPAPVWAAAAPAANASGKFLPVATNKGSAFPPDKAIVCWAIFKDVW
ncbi:hypothetical protein HMPREF0580_0943 [Mobiluncus mulieris ATCC 35239]|uniref:Uncharacterized protein n=1 Tax=Mobiluncus mulieris ATCC 35239 TaxID=871571 RepID=E0QQ16_9ACTO|nr:hypothetical protein HMPREF0577_0296 [Mobiluncus mulieris ATCC 35243]EFM46396.1 hypothetical protein HMPREF0580_0943 [Mobiluncus mulieris ATCC 35239]